MNILQISDVFYPRINGVSTSIQTFKEEFKKLGHEVSLIAPEYTENDEQNDQLIRIPSRSLIFDPEDRLFKRSYVKAITEQLREKQFDIIHIETPFSAHFEGLRLAKELKLPVVETYHTHFEEYFYHYFPFLPKAVLKYMSRLLNRWQCNSVDALIVPSNAMLEILNKYGVTKKIEIIPTGIHERYFQVGDGERFRKQKNISNDRPLLVHVGRVAHEKNIDFLIHLVDRLRLSIKDILLLVAGEGPALTHLKKLTGKLNLNGNVKFVGYLDRDTELQSCYAAADIFVFASRTETQGLVLLEAMAQSTPVVSTAKLGTVDILEAERGAIIADEDLNDFSEKVIRLFNDKDLYQRLKSDARPYANTWSASEMANRTIKFYQKVIDNKYNNNVSA